MKLNDIIILEQQSCYFNDLKDYFSNYSFRALSQAENVLEELTPETQAVVIDDRLPDAGALLRKLHSHAPKLPLILVVSAKGIGIVLESGRDGIPLRWVPQKDNIAELAKELGPLLEECTNQSHTQTDFEERRTFPRAVLREPTIIAPVDTELVDICPSGMQIRTPQELSIGDSLDLKLQLLAGMPEQRITAEVVRIGEISSGYRNVAVRFENPTTRLKALIQKLILEHISYRGLRELPRRFREEGIGCAPIADVKKIAALLDHAERRGTLCFVRTPDYPNPWHTRITSVDRENGYFKIDHKNQKWQLKPQERLDFFIKMGFESYFFEAIVDHTNPHVNCSFPTVLYYSEKRAHQRYVLEPDSQLFVEVDAPQPWGSLRWPLHDVSARGVSFKMPHSKSLMFPGTPLDSLRIVHDDQTIYKEQAEVRHVSVLKGEDKVEVGLVFREPHPQVEQSVISPVSQAPTRLNPVLVNAKASPAKSKRGTAGASSRIHPIKFLNSKNEEISALYNTSVRGNERFASPVVIISPAWGRTKESFSTVAQWLCQLFGQLGKPIVVLRFDFTHCKGESYIPPENRAPGRECLDFRLSSALGDLQSAIRFVHETPLFTPTSVTLVGYSMSGPLVLRAATQDHRVSQVISAMGATSWQETLRNYMGGIDYVAGRQAGHRFGLINFLGYLVDVDNLCDDALKHRFAYMQDLKRDIEALPIPVAWLVGAHDAWIEPSLVKELLATKRRGPPGELVVIPAGHVPTMSDEANAVSEEVCRLVWRNVHDIELPSGPGPDPAALEQLSRAEWHRAPKVAMGDARVYWADYLLGDDEGNLGFDFLCHMSAYREFMKLQAELLDIEPTNHVLDAGGGTGNFLDLLLDSGRELPRSMEIVDFVSGALERAKNKTASRAKQAGVELSFRTASLEVSRLRPIERFVSGEYHSCICLAGRVSGLDDETLLGIRELYGPSMHAALRGGEMDPLLREQFDEREQSVINDVGCLARLLLRQTRPADLKPESAAEALALIEAGKRDALRTSHLKLDELEMGDFGIGEKLPLLDNAYDRIIASLFICYLNNPDETVREFYRALRPGGRLVVSTMKPDSDMSTMFMDFVDGANSGRIPPPPGITTEQFLEQLRAYAGSGAFLLRLVEEQTFQFFSARDFKKMVAHAGFKKVDVYKSFGDPAQAYICVAEKES